MTTDNFCFYLQNRLIQTSQTGGQQYSDTSPFSILWANHSKCKQKMTSFSGQASWAKMTSPRVKLKAPTCHPTKK